MSNHTPAPWIVDINEEYDGAFIISEQVAPNLRYLGNRRAIAQSEANIRLIAAAPDMLATLEELIRAFGHYEDCEAVDMAFEIIANVRRD